MPSIKKVKPEASVQKAFVEWFYLQYPAYCKHVIKISNENSFRGDMMAMGICPGASDILIAVRRRDYAGFWLEIKPPNYKMTPCNKRRHDIQLEFIERMIKEGYYGCMCIGLDSCINMTKTYMSLN